MLKLTDRTADTARTSLWRSRWAAFGAAVAVSLGAGGIFVSQAAPGPEESTIVNVTPERILDSRDGKDLGLPGPFVSTVSQKLQVTGSVPTATGTKTVVPTGATGVLLNVTAVQPTGSGFVSIRPGDATGAPTTSSLNVNAGVNVPNAVQVALPTAGANAGKIDITYDSGGTTGPTTDILIDVVGYTTNTGLQELVADVAALGTGYVDRETGFLGWTDGVEQVVAQLSLPAGTYLITAKVNANNNDATLVVNVTCEIVLGGTVIDSTGSVPLTEGNTTGGSRELLALTSGGTLAAPGTADLVCEAGDDTGNWTARSITATRVLTLEGSATAAVGAPAITESGD